MAAGTRTAPTVDGNSVQKLISMSFIDVSGDIRTESVRTSGGVTDAQIEAYVAAMAAKTCASLFECRVTNVYSGARTVQNATADGKYSADDKVRVTMRNANFGISKRHYLPAPVAELFENNSEQVKIADAAFTDLTTAIDGIETADWSFSTVGFVEHQESNSPQTL